MRTKLWGRVVAAAVLLFATWAGPPVPAAQDQPAGGVVVLGDCLVLAPVGRGARSLIFTDPVEYEFVQNTLKPPKADDAVNAADGKSAKWAAAKADANGGLKHDALVGGYCWWTVAAESARTCLLHATGNVSVYVNGEPRIGDVYGMGIVRLPVRLVAGANHFLFRCARGQLSARLEAVIEGIQILADDATLPDLMEGPAREYCAAVLLLNATGEFCRVMLSGTVGETDIGTETVAIGAYSVRKARFTFVAPAVSAKSEFSLKMSAGRMPLKAGGQRIHPPETGRAFKLAVRSATQNHKVTFTSGMDGSVQYYAVNPARPLSADQPLGIVLSCHGAGVEATSQAAAYGGKNWCHIVCPTNRRHYGFDWEDWGREDAMEVLAHAKATLKHDPSMIYLTGHSMGGHGAWQIAAHHPDKFAAVGPSAGWRSFWSYGGKQEGGDDPISELLRRSENGSDTLLLKQNYAQQGVYILHGDADDNVPVSEARFMHDALKDFHLDLHYHEESGAGHWWDRGDAKGDSGADCVDWQPMFDLFARRRIPAAGQVREIDFTTVSPGISADCHWATVVQQQSAFAPSRVQLRCDPNNGRVSGSTQNVRELMLRMGEFMAPGEPVAIELDGEKLSVPWPSSGALAIQRGEKWSVSEASPGAKNPQRSGGFRSAFRNNCMIVYGTGGTKEVQQWAAAKARFDAEQFWYRGNGSIEVLPDTEFNPAANLQRNVILVGDADTNSAFKAMNISGPVSAQAGRVMISGRQIAGDLALLAVVPRPGTVGTSVGIISGTNIRGMRLANRIPYLAPGVGVPDFIVVDARIFRDGRDGIRAAGFFDNDWRVYDSDTVIR